MERIICNHCEKEIDGIYSRWQIEASRYNNYIITLIPKDQKDTFNLCDECFKKIFNIKEEDNE